MWCRVVMRRIGKDHGRGSQRANAAISTLEATGGVWGLRGRGGYEMR